MFYKVHDPSVTSVGTIFFDVEIPRYTNGFVWYVVPTPCICYCAISAEFSFSISESSVIFGRTDLMLALRPQAGPIFHIGLVYCCCPGKYMAAWSTLSDEKL